MKRLFFFLILFGAPFPVWAQPQPVVEPEPILQPDATRTVDGLIITPLEPERNDIATMMEINQWRFEIQLPAPNYQLNYRVEMRSPAKETVEISRGDYWPLVNTEFTLGLMPKGRESLNEADEIKVFTGIYALKSNELMAGDSYNLESCSNPIKKLGITKDFFFLKDEDSINTDGGILLGQFNMGMNQEPSKSQLFLVLTTEKRPEPAKP